MTDLSTWPALVLTAGLATRLRTHSTIRAKAAIPVAGAPLVVRILEWLAAAGVRRVVLNLHHRAETVTAAVGDGSRWGLEVRYSWESVVLGSAGGPRRALSLLDAERFLIVNGDTLTNCDLIGLARRHEAAGSLVTMALVPGDVARYGGAVVDANGYVTGFVRASAALGVSDQVLHFIGAQAVDARAFHRVKEGEPAEIVRTLYPQLIAESAGAVAAFTSDAEFLDVGTPRDYFDTAALIAAREGRALDCGRDVAIAPDASVIDTILWDRVTIGRGARLRRCIVADEVTVGDGLEFEDSVLVNGEAGLEVSPL